VSDIPLSLPTDSAVILAAALDRERKIDRVLEALGPIARCDVVLVGAGPHETARWIAAGARLTTVVSLQDDVARALPDGSADAIVTAWSAFRGVDPSELAAADRILRPGGHLLVVHDYGRDDVSRLRGDLPEYGAWSRRNGPFLSNGFRVRVVHCFWTFDTIEAARRFLAGAFGADGAALGDALKRPRLSYNVAIYHRTRGGTMAEGATETDSAEGEPDPVQAETDPD
jgi:hypothetical protein